MAALTASVRNVASRVAEPPGRDLGGAPQQASAVARRRLPQVEFKESALETGSSKNSFTKYRSATHSCALNQIHQLAHCPKR